MTYSQVYPNPPKEKKKEQPTRFNLESVNPTKLHPKWKWHAFLEVFVQNLNMQLQDVYKMNYISALNWYCYWMDKAQVQENILKSK